MTDGSDNNPWKSYQRQAAAGKIDIGVDAAKSAAGTVADSLTMMLIGKAAVDRILRYQGFGNLPSGVALGERFFRAARDLDDRLAEDEKILRGMGEMFFIAGKLYEEGDRSAADQFESLRDDRFGNWQNTRRDFTGVPLQGEGRLPGWAGDLTSGTTGTHFPEGNKLPDPSPEVNPQSAENGGGAIPVELIDKPADTAKEGDRWTGDPTIENAYAIEYGTFYALGQSLGAHAQDVVDAAAVWNWISSRLDVAFGDLANGIETLNTSGQWGGKGPEASVTAAMTYRANIMELTTAVSSIGNNLAWTSGWLHTVRLNMPSMATWDGAGGTAMVGRPYARDVLLPRARIAFNNFYVPGVQTSSAAIPAIPPPNKELLTVTPEKPGPGPGPGGGGDPTGGGPRPTGTSNLQVAPGQTPALDQFRRAQQVDPFQREQQEAARRQQEAAERFQREQQQAAREQQTAAAQYQREQQEAARRQQAQQAAQQAASAGQQAAQEALAAAQQAAAGGIPALGGLATPAVAEAARAGALNAAKGAAGSGPGLGGGPGTGSRSTGSTAELSKLFPRAGAATSATGTTAAATGRAGMAPMGGYPGSPGAAGAAGRNAGEGAGGHKRPTYLESTEHLEEAIGEAPIAFRPVVEQ